MRARIASGTMEPALIDHASFLLDIDVFCEIDPPQKERDIANILLEMRESKNYLFGTFVSDKAKATFCAS